ncbi:MAG: anaerobic ribonucleoside-triphosphate reductase, partial [Mailhella sp.]|nr:anaerobic ribonucleoside-triphosphate reductase [Mailhella sp.]
LDSKLALVIGQLDERFEIQARKKVYNAPFLMGQGVWIDSENLKSDDEQREILKHGTLTTGFIGLAECLKALIVVHHGESAEAQELGLRIVSTIRERADAKGAETGMNFTVIATPAEGLAGRFVRIDRRIFGNIPGITDRDYYTNSFHVPVYFPINAFNKLRLEAPYHALTNGGHISYVEVDGDPMNNLQAFEEIVKAMKEMGIGYGSINHPVDRDPVCGYTGIIGDVCPRCGRHDGEGIPLSVLKRIKGYVHDSRNSDERSEAHDKIANIKL